ncbi:uracil-DNA glycosylase [Azoarcus sp. KH32C]|uniref:uracil-DNA glycosylase n=1 Tax=Azoarcus sp. KH32C TaxID=748247 RepID=UPI0002385BAB|nr:uracil-DNA glycosylase [Azoarcus sp. KH32C]BAL27294.1 uracil-DNA glycosylase [Azoarcus sp. KH32C]
MSLPSSWMSILAELRLDAVVAQRVSTIEAELAAREAAGSVVLPASIDRYRALDLVSPADVRVCIAGQDPYHGISTVADGRQVAEAMGLSFSVPQGVRIPPSLRNIYKELAADLGGEVRSSGDLTGWAQQGVLLLNTILSVEKDKPKSHHKLGWDLVTGALLRALSTTQSGIVFVLWGKPAQALGEHIVGNGHTVIQSSHPSPIGGACNKGFFGSRPFSRANQALVQAGRSPISW